MRLCLDEHSSAHIATALRERGHDVTDVSERPELRGLDDADLLEALRAERSALLTENVADFMRSEDHWGIVFSSPASMPRGSATSGLFVDALDRLLSSVPADDGLRNEVLWLQASA